MGRMKKRVVILCTGNSCRSQMAEGLWRALGGDEWEVFSAGTHPAGYVHPLAVEVMREIGIDISQQTSKHVNELPADSFDLFVTVCDSAQRECPTLPGVQRTLHWPTEDPVLPGADPRQQRAHFRTVRDALRQRIASFLKQRG